MPYSKVTYTGNDVQTRFTVPFTYLSPLYVSVTVGGVLRTPGVHYTLNPSGWVDFLSAPNPGALVEIARTTPFSDSSIPSQLSNGNRVDAASLNRWSKQLFHIAQEQYDKFLNLGGDLPAPVAATTLGRDNAGAWVQRSASQLLSFLGINSAVQNISESSSLPLWRGGPWPGGGGALDGALYMRKDVFESATNPGVVTQADQATNADYAASAGSLANPISIGQVSNLNTVLNGKAPTSHTHTTSQVVSLDAQLAGKAATSHTHATSEVTGLDAQLAGKAPVSHTHAKVQISDLETITATPAANVIPKSTGSGVIADGWLSSAIARVSDLASYVTNAALTSALSAYATTASVAASLASYVTTATYTAGLATKAAASHTHPLSQLDGSGAAPGQVPKWNGSSWIPADDATSSGSSGLTGPLPTGGSVGQALVKNSATDGDAGWVTLTKARITDLETIGTTPAANAVPKADGSGVIADGWISSAIARVSALASYVTNSALTATLSAYATTASVAASLASYVTTATYTSGLATKAAASHTHPTSDVTGLDAALAGKAATSHTHATSEVTGLDAALAGKAAASHTHTKSQITDLDTITATPAANGVPKADGSGVIADGWISSAIARVSALASYVTTATYTAGLAGKAPTSHTHPLSNITQSGATTGQVPKWNGSAWVPASDDAGAGAGGGSNYTDTFTGNGSTTAFTLTAAPANSKAIVAINGVVQKPVSDYTITAAVLTFVTAPVTADEIVVFYSAPVGFSSGWIDVTNYGAVGDDFTDCATAFANAIAALPASNGVLYIPRGVYRANSVLNFASKTNLKILGDGIGVTRVKGSVNGYPLYIASSCSDVTVQGITWDGNCTYRASGQQAVKVNCNNFRFLDCEIINSGEFAFCAGRDAAISGLIVRGCKIGLNWADGINLHQVTNAVIDGCLVDGPNDDLIALGICKNVTVTGCVFRARVDLPSLVGRGIAVLEGNENITFAGCVVERVKQHGIFVAIDGGSARPKNILFSGVLVNNVAINSGYGVFVWGANDVTFTGCFIASAGGYMFKFNSVNRLTVQGCTFECTADTFVRGISHNTDDAYLDTTWDSIHFLHNSIRITGTGGTGGESFYIQPNAAISMPNFVLAGNVVDQRKGSNFIQVNCTGANSRVCNNTEVNGKGIYFNGTGTSPVFYGNGPARTELFTGNGSQVDFPLASVPANNSGTVSVNGVVKLPNGGSNDYYINGAMLTFVSGAPASGAKIVVTYCG